MKGNVVSSTYHLMKAKHESNMRKLNSVAYWHTFWVFCNPNCSCIIEDKRKLSFGEKYQRFVLLSWSLQRIILTLNNTMVGERHHRESDDEAMKWKRGSKVWEKLREGGISNYIQKLHG